MFNLIAIDIIFIGVRTALHARIIKETKLQYTATVTILGMIFYDIVEIVWVAGSTISRNKASENQNPNTEQQNDLNKADEVSPDQNMVTNQEADGTRIEQNRLRKKSTVILDEGLDLFENQMDEAGITPEMAKKRGYVRILDYNSNLHLVQRNLAVEEHAIAELRKDKPEIYGNKSILLGNILFLIRILLFHMIIVACATMDGLQCTFLISFELAYLIIITRNFVKYKYLLSIHMFLSKFIQGFFLFSF